MRYEQEMNTPLGLHDLHQWKIGFTASDSRFCLLRDHIALLQDFMQDWQTDRMPINAANFIPYAYTVSLNFKD